MNEDETVDTCPDLEACPECGGMFIHEGGCIYCKDCGYSLCH